MTECFPRAATRQILGVRGDYKSTYTFDLSYLNTGGGDYNLVADRSLLEASVGIRF